MGNEKICEDLAARLEDAKKRIKNYEDELKNPDLPPEDRLLGESMIKFYKNYAALIQEQIAKWCG